MGMLSISHRAQIKMIKYIYIQQKVMNANCHVVQCNHARRILI